MLCLFYFGHSFQHETVHPNAILCVCVYFLSVHCSDTICDGFQAKIPDIEKCLEVVATLQAKKGTGEVCLTPDFITNYSSK
jgi:hypothetical protein